MTNKELGPIKPAILAILSRHPNEDDAAPELRKLAVKHGYRRHQVFSAYRLMKQQRETGK